MPVYDWRGGGLGRADVIDRRTGRKLWRFFFLVDTDRGEASFWATGKAGKHLVEGDLYSPEGATVATGTIQGDFEVVFTG